MGLRRRFWRVVDSGLHRIGLERVSQRPIKDFMLDMDRGIIKVEFRNGFRYAGYVRSGLTEVKTILYPENPIFTKGEEREETQIPAGAPRPSDP